jgi:hypothetical protein
VAWHTIHGTLPATLNDLIAKGYLDAVPVHPFTDKRVEYFVDSPPPRGIRSSDIAVKFLGENRSKDTRPFRDAFLRTGGSYLILDGHVHVLIEVQEAE